VRSALPDVDHVAGDLDRLSLWHDLGERALLVALPAPGDLAALPRSRPEAQAAAASEGECVFVPGLGGMLVPRVSTFGSGTTASSTMTAATGGLDVGTRVDWTAYDADPVPRHRVEALEPSQLERHLLSHLRDATDALEELGGQPFAADAAREVADQSLGGRWGLPPGLPGRAARVITLAGTVTRVVDVALEVGDGALTAHGSTQRRSVLTRLRRESERALADATNAACAVLAGWRPA
jgi:hypothetical protein